MFGGPLKAFGLILSTCCTQNELDEIDSARLKNNGVFGGDIKTGDIPVGQAACSELLYECYGAHCDCVGFRVYNF